MEPKLRSKRLFLRMLYRFICNSCGTDYYCGDKGNKWEKPGAIYPSKVTCVGCDIGFKALPRTDKEKSTQWTFKGRIVGDERERLRSKWTKEVEADAEAKRDAKNERNRKDRKKKKNKK